jgi:hypothetical protein
MPCGLAGRYQLSEEHTVSIFRAKVQRTLLPDESFSLQILQGYVVLGLKLYTDSFKDVYFMQDGAHFTLCYFLIYGVLDNTIINSHSVTTSDMLIKE